MHEKFNRHYSYDDKIIRKKKKRLLHLYIVLSFSNKNTTLMRKKIFNKNM